MAHADDRALHVGVGGLVQDGVQHRDQALAALQAEALVAGVLVVQEALEGVGLAELVQDLELIVLGQLEDALDGSWIQAFSSDWALCMYSTVPVRQ